MAVSFGQGIMFGREATWVAELFAARLRYSGASLGFQIGAALSGGLTPMIASALLLDWCDLADFTLPNRGRRGDTLGHSSCPRNIAPAPRLSDTLWEGQTLRDLAIDAGLAIKPLLTYSGRSQPAHSGVDRAEFPVRRNKTR